MNAVVDPRVDAYIANAAAFAQPILRHVRALVHQACPDVEETIKWSMPTFMHAGGILAGMAAFKQHASFGFWKHAEVMGEGAQRTGMGSYGKMASLADLPADNRLLADIRKAMRINEQQARKAAKRGTASGKRTPQAATPARASTRPPPELPQDLAKALAVNCKAQAVYAGFPPSAQRDYVDWVIEAKREDTRSKRIAQAVQWLAEGKRRNWKYENC